MMLRALPVSAVALSVIVAGGAAAQTPPTTLTLAATPGSSSVFGQAVTLTATVTPAGATGLVTFRDGVEVIGEAPVDGTGTATFTTANLSTGTHILLADHLGEGSFPPSAAAPLELAVERRPTTMSVETVAPAVGVGENGIVRVTVTDTSAVGPPGAPGSFSRLSAGMITPREGHTATRLRDGRVLIVGGGHDMLIGARQSVEIFDPTGGTFTTAPHGLLTPRAFHTATLLQDGTVLIAGGRAGSQTLSTAEIYDPATGVFTAVPGRMQVARYGQAAERLPDGTVLFVGGATGNDSGKLDTIEVYRAGEFRLASGRLEVAREGATATLLADGTSLLVAGGSGGYDATSYVEFLRYDPATNAVTRMGRARWPAPRCHHTATRLPDGSVLLAGGHTGSRSYRDAVIYRPPANLYPCPATFVVSTIQAPMSTLRASHAATLLDSGLVLLTGGHGVVSTADTFRPAFEPSGSPALSSSDLTDGLTSCELLFAGGGVARCDATLSPAAIGSASRTVTVSYAGDSIHLAPEVASAAVSFSVERGVPTIVWPASYFVYGHPLGPSELGAVARSAFGPVAGTYAYSPPAGTVLGAGSHTLSVTFTPDDAANYDAVAGTVQLDVLQAVPTLRWPRPSDIVYGTRLSSTQLNATATGPFGALPGEFSYFTGPGSVLDAGLHALHVDFTPADGANYRTASAEVYLTVIRAVPVIDWEVPASIVYGTPLWFHPLDATARVGWSEVSGEFSYSPPAGTVLDAGAKRVLTATFHPTSPTNYATVHETVTIDVAQATPAISWADPASITYGVPLSSAQLDATATGVAGPLAGSFAYAPEAGSILGAGPRVLSVTFTPDSPNYTPATGTVALDVAQARPSVVWATPAHILHGTALGPEQLDAGFFSIIDGATVPVSGTAVYSPPAGTVLPAGAWQPLNVQFIPDDVVDYTSPVEATVSIDVLAEVAITPGTATLVPGQSVPFTASGGTGRGWSWSLVASPSGGRISAGGYYTAGSTEGVTDVIEVRDSDGNRATASAQVREPVVIPPEEEGGGGCASAGSGSPMVLAGLVLALGMIRRRASTPRRQKAALRSA